jgi:putative transposase
MVFVTKFRRGVLTGKHLGTLGQVFASVCADFGAELVELDAEDDHVHLLVASPPQVAVARLVNSRKGVSARRLRQRSPVRTHRGICGRRRISRPRLVAHRWRPSGRTSASSAPLAGRANPAMNGGARPRKIPVTPAQLPLVT